MLYFNLDKAIKGKTSRASKLEMKDKSKTKPVKHEDQEKIIVYQGALDLMRECARLLHIRWLQAKLMKELIDVIYKYGPNFFLNIKEFSHIYNLSHFNLIYSYLASPTKKTKLFLRRL